MHDLGRKYGVSVSSISRKAAAEGWQKQRATFQTKAQQQIEDVALDSYTKRVTLLMKGGERVAELVCRYLDELNDVKVLYPKDIKAAADALRTVRDLFRTDDSTADDKMQKVRDLLGGVPDALD